MFYSDTESDAGVDSSDLHSPLTQSEWEEPENSQLHRKKKNIECALSRIFLHFKNDVQVM